MKINAKLNLSFPGTSDYLSTPYRDKDKILQQVRIDVTEYQLLS